MKNDIKSNLVSINKVPLRIQPHWDFPGSPVVRTFLSSAGGTGSIAGRRTKIPPKKLDHKTSNIVTKSIKTLKTVKK